MTVNDTKDGTESVFDFEFSGPFEASRRAETWCKTNNISVGIKQRGSPRGLLYGDFLISKWRNLNAQQRAELDGVMEGDMRNGAVRITIFDKDAFIRKSMSSTTTETSVEQNCG